MAEEELKWQRICDILKVVLTVIETLDFRFFFDCCRIDLVFSAISRTLFSSHSLF
jgi:hypothetical protein